VKKVLFITYYWPPSGGAGVQRSLKFVKYLPEFGYSPVVLTVNPEKASYPVLDKTLASEISANTPVHTTGSFEPLRLLSVFTKKENIPYGGFANQNKEKWTQRMLRFIRGNFFIPDARVGWVNHAVRKASHLIRTEEISHLVVSSPPHSSQLIGLRLKKKFPKLKWLADLRDPWTDIYYYGDLLHTNAAKKLDRRYERQVLENCDAAMVVSRDIKELFVSKSDKIIPSKIHVIPNGFDESDFRMQDGPPQDVFRITYVGTMAGSYDPEIFFSALDSFRKKFKQIPFTLRFVGSSSAAVSNLIHRFQLQDLCEFIPHVAHEEAIRYMKSSTALLLVIPAVERANGILTGKLFEYIGAKRPVIAVGPAGGEAAAILNECNAGKMFNRKDTVALENYLEELCRQWESNPKFEIQSAGTTKYSRRAQADALSKILSSS